MRFVKKYLKLSFISSKNHLTLASRMRLLFVIIGNEDRNGDVHGDSIRYGGVGASGTDQSSIIVAEYLASRGHTCVIATGKTEVGSKIRGVVYTNLNMDGIADSDREFDVILTMLWFADLDTLPVRITKALVVVQHMQYVYCVHEIAAFVRKHNLQLGAIHVSQWEMQRTVNTLNGIAECKHVVIPNPIMLDIADKVLQENHQRKNHDIMYFATWNRGAELCKEIFLNELNWEDGKLITSDYTLCTLSYHTDPRIQELGSNDKYTLFKKLAQASYFVYACVNSGPGTLHYDTFGCVVAEALALGVNVLCYPLGALPEVFPDCCEYMPFPEGTRVSELQSASIGEEPALFNAKHVADYLRKLDGDEARQDYLRQAGMKYVRERFGIEQIGPAWETYLVDLCG